MKKRATHSWKSKRKKQDNLTNHFFLHYVSYSKFDGVSFNKMAKNTFFLLLPLSSVCFSKTCTQWCLHRQVLVQKRVDALSKFVVRTRRHDRICPIFSDYQTKLPAHKTRMSFNPEEEEKIDSQVKARQELSPCTAK